MFPLLEMRISSLQAAGRCRAQRRAGCLVEGISGIDVEACCAGPGRDRVRRSSSSALYASDSEVLRFAEPTESRCALSTRGTAWWGKESPDGAESAPMVWFHVST